MTASPELVDDVERDEGKRLEAYPDPRSPLALACIKAKIDFTRNWRKLPGASALSGHPWTIGCGHTGPEVHPGLIWTPEKAREVLLADIESHSADLLAKEPWIAKLDPVRRDILCNMAFNMGVGYPPPRAGVPGKGLRAFVNTLGAIRRGDYAAGADGMLASAWAGQVGDRAKRLAKQMRTGLRA
jgi:lysozyme